jgi:uncharacterized protein (TIGR03086 family)
VIETTATHWEVLEAAHQALRQTIDRVASTDWQKPTPCDHWNVTQVLQHAQGDQLAYASAITGGPGPTENPFTPSGQLLEDPLTFMEGALQSCANAWATIKPDATAATPLPQGSLPASIGVGACALDAAIHAWDIAVATGQRSPVTPTLARSLMPVATTIVEPLRAYRAYAPALESANGDDDVAVLLRYLGRRPDWTPQVDWAGA